MSRREAAHTSAHHRHFVVSRADHDMAPHAHETQFSEGSQPRQKLGAGADVQMLRIQQTKLQLNANALVAFSGLQALA